jgi:mono/diheme cytochrome c family protein
VVLHGREVRLLSLEKAIKPLILFLWVWAAAIILAVAQPFEREAAAPPPAPPPAAGGETVPAATGDAARGQTLYQDNCSSCHGSAGEGGVGPALAGSGLSAAQVRAKIDAGGGTMPAGLVSGQDEDDVIAYVDSIASG